MHKACHTVLLGVVQPQEFCLAFTSTQRSCTKCVCCTCPVPWIPFRLSADLCALLWWNVRGLCILESVRCAPLHEYLTQQAKCDWRCFSNTCTLSFATETQGDALVQPCLPHHGQASCQYYSTHLVWVKSSCSWFGTFKLKGKTVLGYLLLLTKHT